MLQLDCWDGPDGEPIIYHGWTLTSKLLFKDVLMDAIKPYSFKTSPYPVILSIENHCSREQQDKMAEHFKTILGDMLYTETVDTTKDQLPSPEQLKNKILVKAKKIKLTAAGSIEVAAEEDEPAEKDDRKSSIRSKNSQQAKAEELTKSSISTQSRALSDLVNYCEAMKFQSFDLPRNYWEMSSLEETKALQFCSTQSNSAKFVNYNKTNLSRIYPKGTRLLSSNLGWHSNGY